MVKRSEIVHLGGLWLEGHGLSEGSEVLGLSSRVRRAAPRLQTQPEEPVVASYCLAKTATLTVLRRASACIPPGTPLPARPELLAAAARASLPSSSRLARRR